MTTKTELAPLNIGVRDNQLLVDENGDKFVDLLQDLGWDYQRMTSGGRETYDKLMQMLGILEPDEIYMEIQMSEFTPTLIQELKSFLVERMVDNMETKDLEEYVTNDLDQYFESLSDEKFINEAKNYWDDGFDDVVEEIREYADCDFKKDRRDDFLDSLSEGKDLDDYGSKVDALVDSMGVTDKEVSTIHRRKDLDLL